MATSENEFYGQFVSFTPNGQFDKKATLAKFEQAVISYVKAAEEIKPVIISELSSWGKLGEQALVSFVLHSIHLPLTGDNQEKVVKALNELVAQGKIQYHFNEAGGKRGRNSGYTLAGAKTTPPTPPANSNT